MSYRAFQFHEAPTLHGASPGTIQRVVNADNLLVCMECGSLVIDMTQHDKWHENYLPVGKVFG